MITRPTGLSPALPTLPRTPQPQPWDLPLAPGAGAGGHGRPGSPAALNHYLQNMLSPRSRVRPLGGVGCLPPCHWATLAAQLRGAAFEHNPAIRCTYMKAPSTNHLGSHTAIICHAPTRQVEYDDFNKYHFGRLRQGRDRRAITPKVGGGAVGAAAAVQTLFGCCWQRNSGLRRACFQHAPLVTQRFFFHTQIRLVRSR